MIVDPVDDCTFWFSGEYYATTSSAGWATRIASFKFPLCGDLIFQGSVGRTDLPGGNWEQLVDSIRSKVFTMTDATRLLSGLGPETTVGHERQSNPFVGESAQDPF